LKKIALFDPSLRSRSGDPSTNLGDLIIYESVDKCLNRIFQQPDILRISSHCIPDSESLSKASRSDLVFFGGTNALSSDLRKYHQWKLSVPSRLTWPFMFPVTNVILLGVGWWQYQNAPTSYTRAFYKRILTHKYLHSVRDGYTELKLKQLGFENVVNTGCPTMWELDGLNVSARSGAPENCLFTLTDYNREPEIDDKIIGAIVEGYKGKIFFFPQGTLDLEYIASLGVYQKHCARITIINRSFEDYVATLVENDVDYIGTRLHAGIKALQLKKNALILSVDNRAIEISNDTGLPVVPRNEVEKIFLWIGGQIMFGNIRIPVKRIERWKKQFS